MTSPRPGRGTQRVELDVTSYTTLPDETDVAGSGGKQQVRADKCWWRGLWAQCRGKCQLFWQHDYQLQSNKFTPLRKDTRHITFKHYWHCPHSMQNRVYVAVRCPSVCPSVCLSHSPAATACGGFAVVSLVGRKYRSIAAWPAPQQHGAAARRAAENAGSATFTANVGSWTQACLVRFSLVPPVLAGTSGDDISASLAVVGYAFWPSLHLSTLLQCLQIICKRYTPSLLCSSC